MTGLGWSFAIDFKRFRRGPWERDRVAYRVGSWSSRAIQRAAEEQAAREEAEEKAMEAAEEAAEAAESAAEAQAGGGKKGKAAKSAKAKADVAMSSKVKSCTGPGPYKCAKPGAGTSGNGKGKKESPRNKKCEDGEVKVGEHCEKGPGKKQRPDPPVPPPGIIEEAGKDVEGAVDDCIDSGLCEI